MENKPSLFLDRDGVINRRRPGNYITSPSEFIPEFGAMEALRLLATRFGHIVVITNQAGIAKGLMDEDDLAAVHRKMLAQVAAAGGRIDKVYYCPHHPDAKCACRKPSVGMAEQAKSDYTDIDFTKSWMVGDSASDMKLGKAMGMKTVLISGKFEDSVELATLPIDFSFDSLRDFAQFIVDDAVSEQK